MQAAQRIYKLITEQLRISDEMATLLTAKALSRYPGRGDASAWGLLT